MYDVDLRAGEELEAFQDLLGELADEVEGDTAEPRVFEELVEVVRQHLEDQALVVPVHEVVQQSDHVGLVVSVGVAHEEEQFYFRLRLQHERFPGFDDFDRHLAPQFLVVRAHDLAERPFPDAVLEDVPSCEDFVPMQDVVVILVVVPVVVRPPAGHVRLFF
jgi:hypothetical protein